MYTSFGKFYVLKPDGNLYSTIYKITRNGKTDVKTAQVVKTQTKSQSKQKSQISRSRQNANTGYILGLSSLLAWVIPVVGAIVTVSGIYCCYSGMKKRKTLACIGLILNALFLGLAIVNISADFALMK